MFFHQQDMELDLTIKGALQQEIPRSLIIFTYETDLEVPKQKVFIGGTIYIHQIGGTQAFGTGSS